MKLMLISLCIIEDKILSRNLESYQESMSILLLLGSLIEVFFASLPPSPEFLPLCPTVIISPPLVWFSFLNPPALNLNAFCLVYDSLVPLDRIY